MGVKVLGMATPYPPPPTPPTRGGGVIEAIMCKVFVGHDTRWQCRVNPRGVPLAVGGDDAAFGKNNYLILFIR